MWIALHSVPLSCFFQPLYFDGATIIKRCLHRKRREWLETITWKFDHELRLLLPAERTLAPDKFGKFVPIDYPVFSSDFGRGWCDSWMACLMQKHCGWRALIPSDLVAEERHAFHRTIRGLGRHVPAPTRTIPLSFTNGLDDLKPLLAISADGPACPFFVQCSSTHSISSAFNWPILT